MAHKKQEEMQKRRDLILFTLKKNSLTEAELLGELLTLKKEGKIKNVSKPTLQRDLEDMRNKHVIDARWRIRPEGRAIPEIEYFKTDSLEERVDKFLTKHKIYKAVTADWLKPLAFELGENQYDPELKETLYKVARRRGIAVISR